jgi:hypothetical protein
MGRIVDELLGGNVIDAVRKYVECGLGNRWFVRTETEYDDGSEIECRGISSLTRLEAVYVRCCVGTTVLILSSRDGFQRKRKSRNAFKFVVGIAGE